MFFSPIVFSQLLLKVACLIQTKKIFTMFRFSGPQKSLKIFADRKIPYLTLKFLPHLKLKNKERDK